jgi:hypothetical protein
VQGVNVKKVVASNLNSHRIRLNAGPDPRLNFTLDLYHLWADVPLQIGQKTYGNEVDLIVRWAISKQLFFWAPWRSDQGANAGGGAENEKVTILNLI